MKLGWKQLGLIALAIAVAVGGYVAFDRWLLNNGLPEGLIQVNGRIEGDHVAIASKYPGRIQELLVREGDQVTKGQVLVKLDDAQTTARVEQARRAFEAVEAEVQAAHTDLAVLNLDVPLAIEAADAEVAEYHAKVAKAVAVEKEARSDAQRFRELAEKDQASRQQCEQAEMRWDVAKREIAIARAGLAQAQKVSAQAELGWKRIRAKEAEVAALERRGDQAYAALEEAQSVLTDLTITAPSGGTITTRMVDVGEVVSIGVPLLELVNLDRLYLKVYVPELQIGKVRLDLPAKIYTDAFPDRPFDATVRYIASKAEFTPKEVQTPDERVKLIYPVKLYLNENPDHRLTPGLPADAIIRWKEHVAWVKPK
ncbi:MAG: efflux RND transporter periplasmic adaptor subunit [Nitrospira sp.]|nr:efflux RND transporter periplasmic adaptor subunit [Nitrospira sp.]